MGRLISGCAMRMRPSEWIDAGAFRSFNVSPALDFSERQRRRSKPRSALPSNWILVASSLSRRTLLDGRDVAADRRGQLSSDQFADGNHFAEAICKRASDARRRPSTTGSRRLRLQSKMIVGSPQDGTRHAQLGLLYAFLDERRRSGGISDGAKTDQPRYHGHDSRASTL